VVAVVGFLFFVAWQLTEEHPVVDLTLFARRNFWAGVLAISIGYGLFFGNVVLLPLWLQQYMGYTATDAGMIMAPVGALAILLTPIVGKNLGRIDSRRFATIAFLVFALVLWMRSRFNTQADFTTIMIPTVIQGVAMACFFVPLISIILSGFAPDRIPSASGVSNFVRITAGGFGTSIFTTLWENRAAMHHAQLTETLNAGNQALQGTLANMSAAGMSQPQALAQINRIVDQQTFMLSVSELFYGSAILFLCLIPLVWITRSTLKAKKDGPQHVDAAASAAH